MSCQLSAGSMHLWIGDCGGALQARKPGQGGSWLTEVTTVLGQRGDFAGCVKYSVSFTAIALLLKAICASCLPSWLLAWKGILWPKPHAGLGKCYSLEQSPDLLSFLLVLLSEWMGIESISHNRQDELNIEGLILLNSPSSMNAFTGTSMTALSLYRNLFKQDITYYWDML